MHHDGAAAGTTDIVQRRLMAWREVLHTTAIDFAFHVLEHLIYLLKAPDWKAPAQTHPAHP